MPELPEVEIVVRELRLTLIGKTFSGLNVYWQRSFRAQTEDTLINRKISRITRKGKYIILNLDRGCLIIHLRMTGQLFSGESENYNGHKHLRIKISFKDHSPLYFIDQRKFGRIYHVDDSGEILKNVGVDAVADELSGKGFIALLNRSKMAVKAFLLCQKYVSGMGNIYTDECLFRCGIHPLSRCENIPDLKKAELYLTMQEILKSAILNMGTTISDYRDTYGNQGQNQKFLKIYDCDGLPCSVCGSIIKKEKIAGRGTHICPVCQKIY
ncbi:MAG: bifunctional DNA-formamidopyrimidine glycosylase/DNA-(apurinic or apyrimidinic site) lyase [Calditrichaceae bacterium]|nr:bifunctional DNA-formamidopyrimidine glycosylase/DNA-(apurinic or apyrimidinic site) lyase [Calditrichaceae bacterium]